LNRLGRGQWQDWEGIWFSDEAVDWVREHGISPSQLDEIGQMHGFVMSEDGKIVVDVAAGQFGLPSVVVTGDSVGRWYPRYGNALYGGLAPIPCR
jgi:hypothetical protein